MMLPPCFKLRSGLGMALAFSLAGIGTGCFDDRVAGGATETGNTTSLHGRVRDSLGNPVAGVSVTLYPDFYNPFDPESGNTDSTLTDSAGFYRLQIKTPGTFNLAFRQDLAKTFAFLQGVEVEADLKGKSLAAPDANLRKPGRITVPRRILPDSATGDLFIPGSGYAASLRMSGGDSDVITLEDVPAGTYSRLEYVLKGSHKTSNLLASPIKVREKGEETVVGPFSDWNHARRISTDPSAAGIILSGDLIGFPLLIRLDTGNFDFSQASPDGSDIRLAKSDGRPLPFEIEFWDSLQSRAALWVRMDTLRARRPGAYIMLHWGNSGASVQSQPVAVFDTASGFAGAWHLHRESGADSARFANASNPGNPMVGVAPAAVAATSSPLYQGVRLDGKQDKLASANPGRAPQSFTVSLWFQATGSGKLIGFETNPSPGETGPFDRHIWIEPDGAVHFGVYEADPPESSPSFSRIVNSPPGYMDGAWHFVSASQSPDSGMSLYVDGALAGRNADVKHAYDTSGHWVLGAGKHWSTTAAAAFFSGSLDEARVIHALSSADWVKLSFENQKPEAVFPRLAPR